MWFCFRLLYLSLAGIVGLSQAWGDPVMPLPLRLATAVESTNFSVTCFASDLPFPYGMAMRADGSLLVGLSHPKDGGGLFQSVGELRALTDRNGDGAADGPGIALATNLPGTLVDVRLGRDLVFAVSAEFGNEQILCFRQGALPTSPLLALGQIRLTYPWIYHQTYGLAIRLTPETPNQLELFFGVGSLENDKHVTNQLAISGLTTGTVPFESICQISVRDLGDHLEVSVPRVVATGLRNPAGLLFDSQSGDLYALENGIDTPPVDSLSADELNVIPRSDLGIKLPDFGFPDAYVVHQGRTNVGTRGITPAIAFLELDGGLESEGGTQLATVPTQFPAGWNTGIFAAFHGTYDNFGLANDETAIAQVDLQARTYRHFISGSQAGIGHLDGILTTDRALYVADLTGPASITNSLARGAIYRIAPSTTGVGCGPAGTKPALGLINNRTTGKVTLHWSDAWSKCQLEYCDSLAPTAVWRSVVEKVATIDGYLTVEVELAPNDRWYRLQCPACP